MHHLKWLAVPLAVLGLVFLFFGLLWAAAAQLAVAVAFLTLAAATWRTTSGSWPLIDTRPSRR